MGARDTEQGERGAVILAGGDGSRLTSLTRQIMGYGVPKQFCSVLGDETLLEQTWNRISLSIRPKHTVTVVTRSHEQFYARLSGRELAVQPLNRGTAPAILYGLFRLAAQMRVGPVALFPSDHYVSDDYRFMRHVDAAFAVVEHQPDAIILLGITPEYPETQYGWIEPAEPARPGYVQPLGVERFWEKPSAEVARLLWQRGGLWNSFVVIAQLRAWMALFLKALPALYVPFVEVRPMLGTVFEERAIHNLYMTVQAANFSSEVLEAFPSELAVLPVRGVEWNDLGEPSRVMDTLERIGIRPEWLRTG
jgi:mannose-1-phosphate guanylyltransferase